MPETVGQQFEREFNKLGDQLESLNLSRTKTREFMRGLLRPVLRDARRLVPKPGYPGDKPQFKPLRSTLRIVIREYTGLWFGAVGPQWPAGAHGHLVEGYKKPARHHAHGEPTGRTLRPTPFIGPAMEKHRRAILREIREYVSRNLRERLRKQ